MSTLDEICCSLPVDPLPPKRIRTTSVPHAPVRNHRLNETEQKVWPPLVSFALFCSVTVESRPMRNFASLVSATAQVFASATTGPFMALPVCADCDISSASNLLSLSLRHTMRPLRPDPGCAFPCNNLRVFIVGRAQRFALLPAGDSRPTGGRIQRRTA